MCRDAWIEKALGSVPAGARILDAGAGESKYKPLCEHLSYVAQDFGQYNGKGDGSGLHRGDWDQSRLDIICDIVDIPEPDKSFDAILCIEVLEHLPEPIEALRELSRLLKNGGTLILTAPFCSLSHFAPYFFQTGFSPYFYEKWLNELGFEIASIESNGNFFEFLAQELRRIPTIEKKYCHVAKESYLKQTSKKIAMRIMLSWLQCLSQSDNGSKELLCFGYHINAIKI